MPALLSCPSRPIASPIAPPPLLHPRTAANAVRFNTTVSAADARLANMSYAQKISEQRLQRSQERSKWYQLSEEERSEILFPPPRKIQFDYSDATPEQTRQVESHFRGEGMQWRPESMSGDITVDQLVALDPKNPRNLSPDRPAHRPWHAGGGGFEGVGAPGPGTRSGEKEQFAAEKIGVDPNA